MFVLRSFHLLAHVQRLYVTEFMVDLFSSFLFMPFATVIYLFIFTMIVHRAGRKTLMGFFCFVFFISPFLADDVIRAPDLWLAAAAPSRTCEALLHICWAFATAHWDRMHSQESCFLHPGLYWPLEPSGFPKAVSTVPTPCTVVQTHRWERPMGVETRVTGKSSMLNGNFYCDTW